MKTRFFSSLLVFASLLLFAGCTEFPQQSISDAKNALEAARKAEATLYAPAQMEAAVVSYDLARKEITEENRKLPFMRKYSKIIETLKSAQSAAESALEATEATKNKLSSETQDFLVSTQTLADSIDTAIVRAKNKKNNIDTLLMELDSINAKIRDAGALLGGSGNLFKARDRALEVKNKTLVLSAKIDSLFPPKKAKVKRK